MEQTLRNQPAEESHLKINPGFSTAEEYPYLYPLDNLKIAADSLELTIPQIPDYEFMNFGRLLQVVSSIGSCCLSHKLGLNGKYYFLGEKLRIRKRNYNNKGGPLTIKGNAISTSKRKGKALVDIFDEDNSLKYTLELDCNVFSEDTFNKLLKEHADDVIPGDFSSDLPSLYNTYIDEDQFTISIEGFSREQCKGHFSGFPIVPAVFVSNCVLAGIEKWFRSSDNGITPLYVESLEIFANKAIPLNVQFKGETSIIKLATKIFMFVSEIKDLSGNEYGYHIITVQC